MLPSVLYSYLINVINNLLIQESLNYGIKVDINKKNMIYNFLSEYLSIIIFLFIIFDLEIAFLFPWAISLGSLGALGFWSMMVFLGILTIGFIYEWKKGALEWE